MGLLGKSNKNAGWMSVGFSGEGVNVAYLKHAAAGKPVVERVASLRGTGAAIAPALETLGKEWRAGQYHWTNVLNSGEYQLLSVEAPNVPPHELKTAIRWRLKDMLDFHVNDATIDVLDVPVAKDAASKAHAMYAVAARNQLIQERQALFEESRIPLKVIDIPETAQRNIAALMEQPGRGLALLSFDAGGGLLTITFGGELYLARRLDVTLDQLLSEQELSGVLHDRIALELQRSLDHFDRQYRHITLSKLALAPMGPAGAALRDYLAANLYISVEQVDIESLFDISRVPQLKRAEEQHSYFLILGAALREEEIAL
jgi:MSHA biogenesis protein MshI